MMRRWSDGKFRDAPPLADVPLFEAAVRRKSERVAKGNRQRRLLQMLRARQAMERAPDYPLNVMVQF